MSDYRPSQLFRNNVLLLQLLVNCPLFHATIKKEANDDTLWEFLPASIRQLLSPRCTATSQGMCLIIRVRKVNQILGQSGCRFAGSRARAVVDDYSAHVITKAAKSINASKEAPLEYILQEMLFIFLHLSARLFQKDIFQHRCSSRQ